MLVLEDLHWSDSSTVDVLAYLGQRLEPAQLLVLGTYRPVDAMLQAHPLRRTVQELCGRGQALELHLEFLPAADVAAYVAGRCGGPVAPTLAAFVHRRTDGNALFMVNVVEHLVEQGLIVQREGLWTLREGTAAEVARVPEAVAAITGAADRGAHTRGPAGAGSRQRGGRSVCRGGSGGRSRGYHEGRADGL